MSQIIEINWLDRWQVYQRLQALQIPCQCSSNQPLQVQLNDIHTAIQLWSVVKQVTSSRTDLINWLNNCWQLQH